MANFETLHSWERWAPNIGDNRKREAPALFLELATGLTAAQLAGVGKRIGDLSKVADPAFETPEGSTAEERSAAFDAEMARFLADVRAVYVDALGPFVRVEGGPHSVAGQPLATLCDYVALVQQRADLGFPALKELQSALTKFNSFEGPDELFSLRSSGGARSTDAQSTAKDESPPVER